MAMPDALANKNVEGSGVRARVQRYGGYMAGMIMPNISAFIAWGLITALFIDVGWLPNEKLAALVGPILFFLLPTLIGYTGGRMVHGQRGAVVGAVATFGVIVPSAEGILATGGDDPTNVPMFLGAMIMGPLAAYLIKLIDERVQDRVASGFEMLVDNFTAGITAMVAAIGGVYAIGPVVEKLITWLGNGVENLVDNNLLPLASILVEPAKVLFLNNAINHGVLTPLGSQEVLDNGRSILFMVESNPGPGLGLLVAYLFFGPKALRPTAPGAIIIHFLGGIHEIYFPYILMKPKLILATMAGGMSALTIGTILDAGLVGPPAPGSIFAYFTMTPKGGGGWFDTIAVVTTGAVVSFAVASALMGFGRGEKDAVVTLPEDNVLVGT
jgi:PTS system mannitol-specific IIC component